MTEPTSDDYAIPDQWVYLVIDPDGANTVYGTADRERAYELARNTGKWVTKLPVYTDRREEAQFRSSTAWRDGPCAACGRTVRAWEKTGAEPRRIILDPDPTDEGDTIIRADGTPRGVIREDVVGRFTLYRSHFHTCPGHLVEVTR